MDLKKKIESIIEETEANVGVAIKDLNNQGFLLINEEKVFPSASLIKLFILAEVCKQVKEGKIKLSEEITLTDEVKVGGDGILKELNSGHNFTIEELITLMIILSDNTATNIIIDLIGMEVVNDFIKGLGFDSTTLQRKMMDSEAVKANKENFTSAKDILTILDLLYKGELIDEESSAFMIDILKRQQVKGRLDLYLPEDTIIAHKTGDLDYLEHDVGIVYSENNPYIICVLTNENISNKDGREIIGKVSKVAYETFSKKE
ncbi:MAG TPA: serine hydrolase [Tissierellales bacterium]|nr:serine hydrolase [Tissierellales bacterium]